MKITLRMASPGELGWINERYRDIEFVESSAHDVAVVAESDGAPVGLGRIVPLAPGVGELGGIYVFDAFRGAGISKLIVGALIDTPGFDCLYCVPFSHLEPLYASFGFQRVDDVAGVPDKVLKKYRWCGEFYADPAILMRREAGEPNWGQSQMPLS